MITKKQAMDVQEFHAGDCSRTVGPRGGVTEKIERWRRNGQTKTWVTRPDDYRVPVRFGMRARDCTYITPDNAHLFHTADDCPIGEKSMDDTQTIECEGIEYDVEYAGSFNGPRGVMCRVVKAGGGTVGRKYGGVWIVKLVQGSRTLMEPTLLHTPEAFPVTHKGAAKIASEFLDLSGS